MNADEFVESIKTDVYCGAIADVLKELERPPGRSPRPDLVAQSAWFNQLGAEDRERVVGVVRAAAYHAIFGVMAVLDGVQVIDDARTEFYLRTDRGTLLNEKDNLHELFQISVDGDRG